MRTGKRTDSGFTLIEIVVVVAIIAVLTGVIIASINPVQATAAKKAAANTRDALLTGKQYALTRGNTGTYMVISRGDDLSADFYVNGSKLDTETVSTRKVNVKFNNGSTDLLGDSLYIAFDKGSGAPKLFYTGSSYDSSKTLTDSKTRTITITGGGVTYDLTISGLTGRVDMVRK